MAAIAENKCGETKWTFGEVVVAALLGAVAVAGLWIFSGLLVMLLV